MSTEIQEAQRDSTRCWCTDFDWSRFSQGMRATHQCRAIVVDTDPEAESARLYEELEEAKEWAAREVPIAEVKPGGPDPGGAAIEHAARAWHEARNRAWEGS